MKVFDHPRKISKEKWEKFVQSHPHGNVFQTPQMYEVYQETPKYYPVFLAVQNDAEIEGILLAVVLKVHNGVLGRFSSRAIVMGGPIVKGNDPEIARILLNRYDEIVKRKAIYTEFRNLWDTSNLKSSFLNADFNFVEHLNILVDLKKDEEDLWRDVEKRKRNRIRKARKEGITIAIDNSEEALVDVYNVLHDVFKRVRLPLPEFAFFRNLRDKLNGNPRMLVFVARHEQKIIGCSISLRYNNLIYDYYAGAYCKEYARCPNDLIPWEIFLWGKTNGCEIFDFGGAGKPDAAYGVRNYKKKYGGKLVNLGRYKKVHQPIMFAIGKRAFNIWQRFQN